jgi:hypothetical protein
MDETPLKAVVAIAKRFKVDAFSSSLEMRYTNLRFRSKDRFLGKAKVALIMAWPRFLTYTTRYLT